MELSRNKSSGSMASMMRSVINESKEKVQAREARNVGPIELENLPDNKNNIEKALSSLRAPRPRPYNQILTVFGLSNMGEASCVKIENPEKRQDIINARIHTPYKQFLQGFQPLFSNSKTGGLGKKLHQLIDDYLAMKSEVLAHVHEAEEFLRQCQNAEKEYSKHYGLGNEEEVRVKDKFEKSISTLKLVLNVKRLSDQKLTQLKERKIISGNFYNEVHYYLNHEIYEKWETRGY